MTNFRQLRSLLLLTSERMLRRIPVLLLATVFGGASSATSVRAQERAIDPELSPGKREEVQKTMQGPEVLDTKRFSDISFQSNTIHKKDDQHWLVRGDLTLHGQTAPVEIEVERKDGHYQGSAKLRQRAFGITPVAVAGGTVKVKDEVKIEFDIALK